LAMARGAMAPLLAAPWRLMLLSDGSVTRHLQLLTDAKVVVDVLSMEPKGTTTIDSCTHLLHREVDLCDGRDGTPLVYASSWWTPEAAERFGILRPDGAATERAVWMHLSERRTELFREVRRLYRGASPALEEAWGEVGPYWGRHYVFWAGEVPLCVIYEVFSPRLGGFLG
ncbi:predicted protein, partial [Micromonas commoda]